MTDYSILGTTEPFQTNDAFFKELRKQIFGKTNNNFYNIHFPFSYFNFSWSCGYLVLNCYNTLTKREEHIQLGVKSFPYWSFADLIDGQLRYNLVRLYETPEPPKEEKKTFLQILWAIIKWLFKALFWLLKTIVKVPWYIIKWLFT